jgi:hypothetical protein
METSTNENEDWLRSMSWDLPTSLPGLLSALGVDGKARGLQQEALVKLTGLPAWKPCPEPLRSEVLAFIGPGH